MPYRFLPHTADIRMEVTEKTLMDLFFDAFAGMMSILEPKGFEKELEAKPEFSHKVEISAVDKTALLVDFLNEILGLSYTDKAIYTNLCFKEFDENHLFAEISGYKVAHFAEDIKGVTYHEADLKQNEKGEWETTIILDI